MRLAYFSPLGPQKSGIADYSEELLPHLARHAEVDLYVEGFAPTNPSVVERFRVFDYVRDPGHLARLRDTYDAVLCHMGNDHRYHAGVFDALRAAPGVVVLHDFALQDFFLGLARERGRMDIYLDELEACHGREARQSAAESLARGSAPPQAARPLSFPMNARLAREAEAVIVHSEWARERLQRIAPATPVARVNHHITERAARTPPRGSVGNTGDDSRGASDLAQRAEVARSVKPFSPDGRVQICSFGLITPDKGIERALRVLSTLRATHDFQYTLVGEPNSFFDVRELIRRYDLADRVRVTGHVSLEEFQQRVAAADIAVNLRERTAGETSGSLCRIMAAGVAAVVSNVGWFSELPGDCVVKIDMDECADALLHAYLKRLVEDARLRARLGANARRYVLENHRIEQSAAGYADFIREVVAARPRRRLVASVASELSALDLRPGADDGLLRRVASEVSALAPASVFRADAASHGGNGAKPPVANASAGAARTNPDAHTDESAEAEGGAPGDATNGLKDDSKNDMNDDAKDAERRDPAPPPAPTPEGGRTPKVEGIDYKRAAVEYPRKITEERLHHLRTKPFYNLANKPERYGG
ncbi:MAG TPA: glycosyltransferase family 4 protein, partial [Pyrinomonadaceae bacterium]|nr:glycosyltransferase family 4 protein [Pyrinomonadaceae bacterium]